MSEYLIDIEEGRMQRHKVLEMHRAVGALRHSVVHLDVDGEAVVTLRLLKDVFDSYDDVLRDDKKGEVV